MPDKTFEDVKIALQLNGDETMHIAFGNVKLDDAPDFFRYLGTDEGQDELGMALITALIGAGVISVEDAADILLS